MKSFLLCILFLTFITNITAQKTSDSDTLPIHHLVNNFYNALSALDVTKAKSFCSNDLKILETGKVWTFDSLAVRITIRKSLSADFKRINNLSFIQTNINGNAAWTSYWNEAVITFDGKTTTVKWLESIVAEKQNKTWKITLFIQLKQKDIKFSSVNHFSILIQNILNIISVR